MNKKIPLLELIQASYWPWNLHKDFTVTQHDPNYVIIEVSQNISSIRRDKILRDLQKLMAKEGFSAYPRQNEIYAPNTEEALVADNLLVSVWWAEDKLMSPTGIFNNEYSPNHPDFNIIATGPLIRKGMEEPIRVVLRHLVNLEKLKYVVHTQCILDGIRRCYFCQGDYFWDDQRKEAVQKFTERLIELEHSYHPHIYQEK